MTIDLSLTVVAATRAEVPRLAGVLSAAYLDNPVFDWMFDGDQAIRHPAYFEAFLHLGMDAGRVEQTADGMAVAVWIDGAIVAERAVLDRFRAEVRLACGHHLARWRKLYSGRLPVHGAGCWELALLGVRPDHQGRGHGRLLLDHATGWRGDVRAYAELPSRRLVNFFARHGFEDRGRCSPVRGVSLCMVDTPTCGSADQPAPAANVCDAAVLVPNGRP